MSRSGRVRGPYPSPLVKGRARAREVDPSQARPVPRAQTCGEGRGVKHFGTVYLAAVRLRKVLWDSLVGAEWEKHSRR